MSEHVILATPHGTALADPAVPCVITQWHGFANAAQFIAVQEAALHYFEQYSTPQQPWGWVGDVRQMGAIPADAQHWLQSVFNPRARAAGLRLVSVVVAETVFGRIATEHYAQQTHANPSVTGAIAVEYYQTLADARQAIQDSHR